MPQPQDAVALRLLPQNMIPSGPAHNPVRLGLSVQVTSHRQQLQHHGEKQKLNHLPAGFINTDRIENRNTRPKDSHGKKTVAGSLFKSCVIRRAAASLRPNMPFGCCCDDTMPS